MQIAKFFVIIITGAVLLGGCSPYEITEVDWGAEAYERQQRSTCRTKCRFSAYADAVETECYGDCMLERGFFCKRDFRGQCFDTTGTGIAETCIDSLDNFECVTSRPLPDEYQPGGSKWKAHKEYSKCLQNSYSFGDALADTIKEITEKMDKKCGHLLPEPPDTDPRFYTEPPPVPRGEAL